MVDTPDPKRDPRPRPLDTAEGMDETDLASGLMGSNKLEGDAQENVHNQRQAVAEEKGEPDDGPLRAFELMDKDARAEAELGKGNRHRSGGDER